MRTLAVLVALALLLAGCSGGSDPDPTSSSTTAGTTQAPSTTATPTTQSTTTSATTTGSTPNRAPTATLAASVPGGELPLNVTFTLGAADPDGDNLTYTFDADGQAPAEKTGTGPFPVTVVHQFGAAGNHTATLEVSDGEETVSRTVTISVVPGEKAVVTFTGHIVTPDPWGIALGGCLLQTAMNDLEGPGDVAGNQHALEPAHSGWAYAVTPAGTVAEYWNDEPAILETGSSGTVPEGATRVNVCSASSEAADVDYILTLTEP